MFNNDFTIKEKLMIQSRIITDVISDLNIKRAEYGKKFMEYDKKEDLANYKYWGGKIEEIDRILVLLNEKNSLT